MCLPLKIVELEFTVLEFYPNYVSSQPREGQVLEGKKMTDLVEVCTSFYNGKYFVYLSNRINDYNVNPTVYINLHNVKNLAGIGIICKNQSAFNTATFEKQFSKIPYEVFREREPALQWINNLIAEKNKKADL